MNVFDKPNADKLACMLRRENVCCEETNVFDKPNADKLACMLRRENVCCEETNVFDKPNADKLACMLRRENVCCERHKQSRARRAHFLLHAIGCSVMAVFLILSVLRSVCHSHYSYRPARCARQDTGRTGRQYLLAYSALSLLWGRLG